MSMDPERRKYSGWPPPKSEDKPSEDPKQKPRKQPKTDAEPEGEAGK